MEALSPEVLEDLRHGRATRERKIAVCTGGAHLGPADRAEILAVLAGDAPRILAGLSSGWGLAAATVSAVGGVGSLVLVLSLALKLADLRS